MNCVLVGELCSESPCLSVVRLRQTDTLLTLAYVGIQIIIMNAIIKFNAATGWICVAVDSADEEYPLSDFRMTF